MAVFQKRRGPNGSVEFYVDGEEVGLHAFVDASEGKENIYTALRDSRDPSQLRQLQRSLRQHDKPSVENTVQEIEQDIREIEGSQKVSTPKQPSKPKSYNKDTQVKEIEQDIQELEKMQKLNKPTEITPDDGFEEMQEKLELQEQEKEIFNSLGLNSDDVASMTSEEKRMWKYIGNEKLESAKAANPIVDPLSDKVINNIREKVKNDPGINKFERKTMNKLIEDTKFQVKKMQRGIQEETEDFENTIEESKENLAQKAEQAGQTFSPVRQQKIEELEDEESGMIGSFAQDQSDALRSLGRQLEEKIGSENVDNKLGDILSLKNTMTGDTIDYNKSSVNTTYEESDLGRQVGNLQRNQEEIERNRIESVGGIKN